VAGSEDLLRGISAVKARQPDLPVLVVGLGFSDFDRTGVTVFDDAETATDALARAVSYSAWRSTPAGELPAIDVRRARLVRTEAQQILAGPASASGWLAVPQCQTLLGHYDIHGPLGAVSTDVDELRAAADSYGYPVAVKAADPSVLHKTDRGLVHLGVGDPGALQLAVDSIRAEMNSECEILVQPQVTGGVEVALGTVRDPRFGPVVMVAAGGIATEVWADRQFLMPPVTEQDARRALAGLRIHPLFKGFRGSAPVDIDRLVELVTRLGVLVSELPEVAELDLNPVIASADAMHIVDAKIRLVAGGPEDLWSAGL
jgi:acyl-CoA synthetase (NDP forming)